MKWTGKLILFMILFLPGLISAGQVKKVESIGITVKEMDRSLAFYTKVLGFRKISDREWSGDEYENLEGIFGLRMRVVRLQLGDEFIELTDYLTAGGRSIPENAKSNDLSFQHMAIVVSDMDRAFEQLRKYHVEFVSTAPQTLPLSNTAAAGIRAFYFHDPDNHNIELIFFPRGKGQPKWQNHRGKLFLGIDHTAIGISNTHNSLQFYQDLIGLERKGESWNQGTEQEHLNNVEGAKLHITGLRSGAGPGIEFLEYLNPGAGRPYPADTRADDIWFWQTSLVVADVDGLYEKLRNQGYSFVSKGLILLHPKNARPVRAFVVKDPDGHALLIRE